jgi:Aldo/keto reductase family
MQHPGVTAPIIGPRTMEHLQSQMGAAQVTLSIDLLDRIDEIVPPGVTIASSDGGYQPPALGDPFLRRRRSA